MFYLSSCKFHTINNTMSTFTFISFLFSDKETMQFLEGVLLGIGGAMCIALIAFNMMINRYDRMVKGLSNSFNSEKENIINKTIKYASYMEFKNHIIKACSFAEVIIQIKRKEDESYNRFMPIVNKDYQIRNTIEFAEFITKIEDMKSPTHLDSLKNVSVLQDLLYIIPSDAITDLFLDLSEQLNKSIDDSDSNLYDNDVTEGSALRSLINFSDWAASYFYLRDELMYHYEMTKNKDTNQVMKEILSN